MTDYAELKRLAEAFPADLDWDSNTEPFFNGPSGESLGGGATGFYSVYGKPFRLEGEDYDYDGPTYVEVCPADFAKFMVAARDGVLALIAERDALAFVLKRFVDGEHDQEENQADRHMYFTEAQSLLALGSGELEAHTIVPDSAIKAIQAERDQLKVENEALRKCIDDMSPLKGAPLVGPNTKCLACGGYHYGMGGLPCPNMRITAQAELPETRSGQIGAHTGNGEKS